MCVWGAVYFYTNALIGNLRLARNERRRETRGQAENMRAANTPWSVGCVIMLIRGLAWHRTTLTHTHTLTYS